MSSSLSASDLPTGPRGRLLALALTLLVVAGLIFGIIGPGLSWYNERNAELARREVLASHMAALAATRPALQHAAADLAKSTAAPDALLAGGTDAVTAASMQEKLQTMAGKAGAQLASVEILPATQIGRLRRIGLRVALDAPLAEVMHLFASIDASRPRMLFGEFDLQRHIVLARPNDPDVDARFVVYAFRAGTEPPGGAK